MGGNLAGLCDPAKRKMYEFARPDNNLNFFFGHGTAPLGVGLGTNMLSNPCVNYLAGALIGD